MHPWQLHFRPLHRCTHLWWTDTDLTPPVPTHPRYLLASRHRDSAVTTACRGLIGAATVALALTGVEASGKLNFKNISKHLTTGHSSRTTVTHSSGKKFISAKVSCDSDAYASAYSDWKSSYIKAGAPPPPPGQIRHPPCHCLLSRISAPTPLIYRPALHLRPPQHAACPAGTAAPRSFQPPAPLRTATHMYTDVTSLLYPLQSIRGSGRKPQAAER